MAFYDSTDAVYGIARYGSASYGIVQPTVALTGVSATANTRTIHLNVFEVDITEPLYNAQAATGSVGTLTLNTTAGISGVSSTASVNSVGAGVKVTTGSVESTISTNTVKENITLTPWSYSGDDDEPILATFSIDNVTVYTVNIISVTGVSATGAVNTLGEIKTSEALESVSATLEVNTVKANLLKHLSGVSATIPDASATGKNNSKLVVDGVQGTISIGEIGGGVSEDVVTGVEATVSINPDGVTVHVVEVLEDIESVVDLGTVTVTAAKFDFEAVKTLYSHRRTVVLPRAA